MDKLLGQLLREISKCHRAGFQRAKSGFPLIFPLAEGRVLAVSMDFFQIVDRIEGLAWDRHPDSAGRITRTEFRKLLNSIISQAIDGIDLAASRRPLAKSLAREIEAGVAAALSRESNDLEFAYGADLFGSGARPSVVIGPVALEPRDEWLARQQHEGTISATSMRRIGAAWSGKKLRSRKPSLESSWEDSILSMAGNAAYVCSVRTSGLAPAMAGIRGRRAARLAMTSITLLWPTPSQTSEWFRLRYDGAVTQRNFVTFHNGRIVGSSLGMAGLPDGIYVDAAEWAGAWKDHRYLFDVVGNALFAACGVADAGILPKLGNSYFQALWWFHAASREDEPLLAIVKFAAVLDALAGGRRKQGILALIEARLRRSPEDKLFRSGAKVREVVDAIYSSARSRAIHGTHDRIAHDWLPLARQAETLARLILLSAARWIHHHKGPDNIELLRVAPHSKRLRGRRKTDG